MVTHSVTMNRFDVPTISRYYARRRQRARAREEEGDQSTAAPTSRPAK
jgi:hypothetical protein